MNPEPRRRRQKQKKEATRIWVTTHPSTTDESNYDRSILSRSASRQSIARRRRRRLHYSRAIELPTTHAPRESRTSLLINKSDKNNTLFEEIQRYFFLCIAKHRNFALRNEHHAAHNPNDDDDDVTIRRTNSRDQVPIKQLIAGVTLHINNSSKLDLYFSLFHWRGHSATST